MQRHISPHSTGEIEAEVWSSKLKVGELSKEHPHIVTIKFNDLDKGTGAEILHPDNVKVECHNPGCQKNFAARDVSSCKHAIAVLLSRVEKVDRAKTLTELCSGVPAVDSDDSTDDSEEDKYKFEYILAHRENEQTRGKEYLVKWGPARAGPRGGLVRYGYGGDLDWISEGALGAKEQCASLEAPDGCDDWTGIDQYNELLQTLQFVGLKRENTI